MTSLHLSDSSFQKEHVELFVASSSYSNPANQDNELSFKNGDIIVILQKNASGWWLGKTSPTTVGYFSKSFGKCHFCKECDLPDVIPQFYGKGGESKPLLAANYVENNTNTNTCFLTP